jgi:hypothetical protein
MDELRGPLTRGNPMSFPEITNGTSFAVVPVYLADEEGNPLLTILTRASFLFDGTGRFFVAEKQLGIHPAGIFNGEQGSSSYKFEPDVAFSKQATDVVLIGSAYAAQPGTTQMDVSLKVGPLEKTVRVFGDRYWFKGTAGARLSDPQPFERMPLLYDLAFGGWDRWHPDPAHHRFEPRNPMGRGYCAKGSDITDDIPLPNLEDPREPIGDRYDCPPPAGFGFTSPDWLPRAQLAGTYDAAWSEGRAPLLPQDFDRRFFSAASTGLVAPGYLRGDEAVQVRGVAPGGDVQFSLPGIGRIEYCLQLRGKEALNLQGKLDTVVIDTDECQVHLTWRASVVVPRGPQDVLELDVTLAS